MMVQEWKIIIRKDDNKPIGGILHSVNAFMRDSINLLVVNIIGICIATIGLIKLFLVG